MKAPVTRNFSRMVEPSFPENDALPKKAEEDRKFDKNFNDWYEDLKINLDRFQDQLNKFFQKELSDGLQTQATETRRAVSLVSSDLETSTNTVNSNISGVSDLINNHATNTNNPHLVTASQLNLSTLATSGDWSDIDSKPSTFPPEAHTHAISEITNLQSALDDKANSSDVFSGDYDDLTNKPTIPTVPGNATTSADGLMSSGDKTKLDGIPAPSSIGVVTSISSETWGTNSIRLTFNLSDGTSYAITGSTMTSN